MRAYKTAPLHKYALWNLMFATWDLQYITSMQQDFGTHVRLYSTESFYQALLRLIAYVYAPVQVVSASSAAVERIFSIGGDILRAKRSALNAFNFEQLIFVKGNMDLLSFEQDIEEEDENLEIL